MTRLVRPWEEHNRLRLLDELARIRGQLERHTARAGTTAHGPPPPPPGHAGPEANGPAVVAAMAPAAPHGPVAAAAAGGPAAIDALASVFGLSSFERDVLLLAAGAQLDPAIAGLLRACGAEHGAASLGVAMAALEDAHWSALTPDAPLRFWRLADVADDDLVRGPLRVDEPILHYLAGVPCVDPRVRPYARLAVPPELLPGSQADAVARLESLLRDAAAGTATVVLEGRGTAELEAVAAVACTRLELQLLVVDMACVPRAAAEQEPVARGVRRESLLHQCVPLVVAGDGDADALPGFLRRLGGPVLCAGVAEPEVVRGATRIAVPAPTGAEREVLWREALGGEAALLNGALPAVAAEFDLSAAEIRAAARTASLAAGAGGLEGRLWSAARSASRARLDALAERIPPRARWDDLVLPRPQLEALRVLTAHVRHREQVRGEWGFGERSARGLGVSALFAGASGTGKTMAAEVIAAELELELYRIDLSQVVSKFIGETEKNLKRVFDAAESGGVVLLFDEADALFGRRSEVRDSHDRYANIEVSYLLQRVDAFRGLAVLTTNLKSALDPAFLRRIRFVVEFPFPDAGQRAEIWRRAFPPRIDTRALDFARLGRLSVAGGNIRNIAMISAVLSADARQPLGMQHLLRAARIECAKLDRTISDAEVAGWC